MSEFHNTGESIECLKCEINARKYVISGLFEDDYFGRHTKYKCSLNSSAKILSEVADKTNDQIKRYRRFSHFNEGDKLLCKNLYFLHKSIIPVKHSVVNLTSTHKAHLIITKALTYAEIEVPHENVLNSLKKRALLNSGKGKK